MFTYNTHFLDKPISFIAIPHGKDYAISIMGGDEFHIGATAVCVPGSISTVVSVPGHKEEPLALELATMISLAIGSVVCVSIGIHYHEISKDQINQVVLLVSSLKDDFIKDVLLTPQS